MIRSEEYLERVVAAIQAITTSGAVVNWNETINGRQFDVVVRFTLGTLRYLVLVEVKNRSRKTEASDLEAFVTKTRDNNANKAVFVTVAGFQEGAKIVAKRHGIELFTVTFDDEAPTLPDDATIVVLRSPGAPSNISQSLSFGEPRPVHVIERATIVYEDGKTAELPTEQSQMTYYCQKTKLNDGRPLADVFQCARFAAIPLEESRDETIRLDPPQAIEPPDAYFYPAGVVIEIKAKITARMGRPILGSTMVDPGLISAPVIYTNALTGEAERFNIGKLPLGVKRVSVGKFYFSYHPLKYYYSDRITGETVRWHMIESFQNGEIVTATFTQNIKWSASFIPVTDKATLNRLQRRLEDYRRRDAKID